MLIDDPFESSDEPTAAVQPDLEIPRVSPVGILERPEGFETTPRQLPAWQRAVALVLLVVFFVVTLVTGAVSFGYYCLTTDTGDTRALPDSYTNRPAPAR